MRYSVIILLTILSNNCFSIINPVTDVNWNCMFPMTVAGVAVVDGNNAGSNGQQGNTSPICSCLNDGVVKVGTPLSFWEPFAMVDTTYEAWNMLPLGVNLGMSAPYMLDGARGGGDRGKAVKSNIHYFAFPVFKIMDMFHDLPCLKNDDEFDILMVSEVLPFFQNDLLSLSAFPETLLVSNPVAALACMADAASTAAGFPIDSLFWCLGAGNLYPISGSATGDNIVSANSENAARGIYFMGRTGLLREYHWSGCYSNFVPIWTKSRYKFHLWYPMLQSLCVPFGYPELVWTAGLPADSINNDMSYLVWRKVDCCTMGVD